MAEMRLWLCAAGTSQEEAPRHKFKKKKRKKKRADTPKAPAAGALSFC